VVGQEHVVEALSNALDADRIHHAFLFSGTRGVGKTTLARIFAKALNCERGVSSSPCQECSSCLAVDEGRFIDLIEVDAASRTKVEDTRELLDNVQYAPTSGRYKVYLIDEVHMLSIHSFNALLKTLEEPPQHVKFLLATTDPQKLPVTVLSRCLQFNLKALRPEQITGQLVKILTSDDVEYDDTALDMISRAADGSMRDALSLMDQAVAHGGGAVREESVRNMLGTIRSEHSTALIEGLLDGDADRIMQTIHDMSDDAVDFIAAMDELLLQLYYLSLAQNIPSVLKQKPVDYDALERLAERVSAEDIQLYYQIGLIGKRDITLAPDVRTGFEMTMLRMLSFRPVEAGQAGPATNSESSPESTPPSDKQQDNAGSSNEARAAATSADTTNADPARSHEHGQSDKGSATEPDRKTDDEQPVNPAGDDAAMHPDSGAVPRSKVDWGKVVSLLELNGLVNELAMHCVLVKYDEGNARLVLSPQHEQLLSESRQAGIATALSEHFGREIRVSIAVEESEIESPAQVRTRLDQEKLDQTREALYQEKGVQELMEEFGAIVTESSIRPNDS
jgi:DNA polymerase-3 subunit gamma/tau